MFEEPTGKAVWFPKEWNGHKWFWCGEATNGHCERYRQHKGKDCKSRNHVPDHIKNKNDSSINEQTTESSTTKQKSSNSNKKVTFNETPKTKKKLKLTTAIASVVPQEEEDGDYWSPSFTSSIVTYLHSFYISCLLFLHYIISNDSFTLFTNFIHCIFTIIFLPLHYIPYHRKRKPNRYFSHRKGRPWNQYKTIISLSTLIAMSSTTHYNTYHSYDTDSVPIGIDNRCSACISHCTDDFVGPLLPCNRVIKGYNGSLTRNIKRGTLRWFWTDDQGRIHEHLIPNSYYSPSGGVRLLSPQHWSQTNKKSNKIKPSCTTNHKEIKLCWGNDKFAKTVPLSKDNNVATFHSAPGYNKFTVFESKINDEEKKEECSPQPLVVNDTEILDYDKVLWLPVESSEYSTPEPIKAWKPSILDKSLNSSDTSDLIRQEQLENRKQRFLRLHQDNKHIPFPRLREMAKQGEAPAEFINCPTPACLACLYGRATKRPWRNKTPKNKAPTVKLTKPGQA